MGCTNDGNNSFFSNLKVQKISGLNLICGNPLFWNNGESLIVTTGASCQMFSVSTGERVKELFVCDSRIVSCQFHPNHSNLLIALTENGEILTYNLNLNCIKSTCKLLLKSEFVKPLQIPKFGGDEKHEKETNQADNYLWDSEKLNSAESRKFLYGIAQYVDGLSLVLFWTSWSMKDEPYSHITIFCYTTGNHFFKARVPLKALKKCYKNFAISKTSDKNVVFVGMGTNYVYVCHYENGKLFSYSSKLHLLGDAVEATTLTFHPRECSFATSDSRGLIMVWKNIFARHPVKTSYLWHTQRIYDVAFSDQGSHVFSGGEENVLVKWSILSNRKDFLPRLSSVICFITICADSSLVAISLANNEILIINSAFQKISVIQEYLMNTLMEAQDCHNILTSDPQSENLVLNGRPGYLQFLSYKKNLKLAYLLDLTKANYMTGDENLANLEITHAKFNKNGSWLVTAEIRKDKFLKESRLKFWMFDEQKQAFVLNTNIELPHNDKDIHSLEISSDDVVATSGSDKHFRLWATFNVGDQNDLKTVWSCLCAKNYKLLPCNPLDFCRDATLLAVGFGPSLTLWSTNDCSLKCSLTPPFKRDYVKFVKFGNDEHSHLVVSATDSTITTWNVITLTIVWNVKLEVSYIVGGFFNTFMCVFSSKNTLFIFSPGSSSPDFVLNNISKSPIIAAHTAFYANNENSPFHLYFLNAERELFCLKLNEDSNEVEYTEDTIPVYVTTFSSQIAQKTRRNISKTISNKYASFRSKADFHYVSSILDAPAHALPNPSLFCSDVLKSLMTTIKTRKEKTPVPDTETSEVNNEIIEMYNKKDINKGSQDVSEENLYNILYECFPELR